MADHYETEVNEGDVNMRSLQRKLNGRYEDGWKLAHMVSQGENLIMVWERLR
ncbi:MAG: hypothetical protein M3285_13140 [Actinomycetota bacterium]|nr:hypothetical protein [Actinomycetota bacterium]